MATLEDVKPFDVNLDATGKALLPGAPSGEVATIDQYVASFTAKADELFKAISAPPSMTSFARISYMPDATNAGVLPWPGIAPESIGKIVRENIAPQLVIGMRIDDVLRYSTLSTHLWRPGWQIELFESHQHPTDSDKKDMREAEKFLQNSNIETKYSGARDRDGKQLTDFQNFLSELVRDSLSYDAVALWTEMAADGKVKSYALLPAAQIRLCGPQGYQGDKTKFAVAVDEGGTIINAFTRDQLVYYVRNPRTDPMVGGYGYPEIEMAVRLIQGFQNAVDLNVDTFNRSGIPNGILLLKGGGWTQRQLDVLTRIWTNLKKGITKVWSLPVVATPTEGDISVVNLQDLKGTDVRYQDHMNMMAGAFCTIYRFPVRRLGYRISGRGPDTQPVQDGSTQMVDEDDPGLAPLLIHIQNIVNQYLIWSRWPNLRFVFNGKNPKEDAREYEAKKNAMTWGEARAAADMKSLEQMVEAMPDLPAEQKEKLKRIANIMTLCPIDPNISGSFQSLIGAYSQAEFAPDDPQGEGAKPGNRMESKVDPAKSEEHGATSGVRRSSRAEGSKKVK